MGNAIRKSIRLSNVKSYQVPKDILVLIVRELIKQNNDLAVPLWLSCRKLYYDEKIKRIASISRVRSSLIKIINYQYKKIDIEIVSSNPSIKSKKTCAESKNHLYYDENGFRRYLHEQKERS